MPEFREWRLTKDTCADNIFQGKTKQCFRAHPASKVRRSTLSALAVLCCAEFPRVFVFNPFSQLRRYTAIAAQNHLINEDIKAAEVRLVGADGSQLGIMETSRALAIAEESGMDLVLIAPQATPPVCRVMDYGKYKFDQQKREKEANKKQKTVELKEIRLSLNIDVHDFETKVSQAKKFLSAGNKLKVSIRFRGREMAHTDRGIDVMNRFQEALGDAATVDKPAKLEGRSMQMSMSPRTGKKTDN